MEEGWEQYQKLVLSELERLNGNVEKLTDKIHQNEMAISNLSIKTSILAAVAGSLSAIGTSFLNMFKN